MAGSHVAFRGVRLTVELQFVVPSADLADHITLLYHFCAELPHFADTERAGHAQLRFRLRGDNSRYRFADGSEQTVGAIHLIGPTTGSTLSSADGPIEVIGLGLTPAGWAALVGSDASAMVNRAVDCGTLFDDIDTVASQLQNAADVAGKVAVAEAFIRHAAGAAAGDVVEFARLVDVWLAGATSPALEALEAATGLSRRQVERRCKVLYGAPPKMLARKYRALRAAVAVVADGENLDDLLARGFYDQSHLIREIKQFTGCTPRQLRANPSLLAHMTIMQRSALEGQVIPLVSQT
ncbi:MAG: helix-turn-helix domain-containing protein [Pseudomonadota bacterium]